MRGGLVSAALCAVLVGAVCPLGCAVRGSERSAVDRGLRGAQWLAFQPASVRISPLTRIEDDASDGPRLVVYFELVDGYGHGTKALGLLRAELFRGEGRIVEFQKAWESDLTDARDNSAFFDVTGLYRVPLVDPPAWLTRDDGGAGVYTLRVFFTTLQAGGEPATIGDELRRRLAY